MHFGGQRNGSLALGITQMSCSGLVYSNTPYTDQALYKSPPGILCDTQEEQKRRDQAILKTKCSLCQKHFVHGDTIIFCYTAFYCYHAEQCFRKLNKRKCQRCKQESIFYGSKSTS